MSKRTDERMALRREERFSRHHIEVTDEKYTDIRNEQMHEFNHAVRVRGIVQGRTWSRRSAMKKAHQIARNLEAGAKAAKRKSKKAKKGEQ